MKKIVLITSLIGMSYLSLANVNVKSLDIYKNKTFANQQLNVYDNNVELLSKVKFEDLRFIIDGECSISNTSVLSNNFSKDNISMKIEEYQEDIAFKENEIRSINNTIKSLESISFGNQTVSLDNIKNISSYSRNQLEKNYNLVYKLNKELKKHKFEFQKLISKKKSNIFSLLNYSAKCKDNSKIYVNYPILNVQKNSFYEINADSENKSINIKNTAFLVQNSGHDFKDIDINVYTYNYINQINPKPFYPQYLDVYVPPVMYMESDQLMMKSSSVNKRGSMAKRPSFSYNETTTKSFFKASNITLESGIKKSVIFAHETYKMNDKIEIDGFGISKPFYKIDFTSDKLFSASNSKRYLDSVFIGNSYEKEIKKDKKTSLYFGEDRFIDVKKELIKDMKEKPFFAVSKIKTEKLWKYTITNNHKSKKTIRLIERLPVSKHEDIKVKLISKNKYTKKDINGKISYDFVLKANEKRIIEFGYLVEKPYKNNRR